LLVCPPPVIANEVKQQGGDRGGTKGIIENINENY